MPVGFLTSATSNPSFGLAVFRSTKTDLSLYIQYVDQIDGCIEAFRPIAVQDFAPLTGGRTTAVGSDPIYVFVDNHAVVHHGPLSLVSMALKMALTDPMLDPGVRLQITELIGTDSDRVDARVGMREAIRKQSGSAAARAFTDSTLQAAVWEKLQHFARDRPSAKRILAARARIRVRSDSYRLTMLDLSAVHPEDYLIPDYKAFVTEIATTCGLMPEGLVACPSRADPAHVVRLGSDEHMRPEKLPTLDNPMTEPVGDRVPSALTTYRDLAKIEAEIVKTPSEKNSFSLLVDVSIGHSSIKMQNKSYILGLSRATLIARFPVDSQILLEDTVKFRRPRNMSVRIDRYAEQTEFHISVEKNSIEPYIQGQILADLHSPLIKFLYYGVRMRAPDFSLSLIAHRKDFVVIEEKTDRKPSFLESMRLRYGAGGGGRRLDALFWFDGRDIDHARRSQSDHETVAAVLVKFPF